jgi:glycosyltransferase involved in cell wall biosynthesis
MRLAVVIPVYNHAAYVGKAIESVLAQTRRPDRIICIDDGSRDDSLAVCQSFSSRGVEVLAQENKGAHATINRLIAMASGDCETIAILNSDDFYHVDRFARCLPLLETNTHLQVVSSGLSLIDPDNHSLPPDHPRGQWLRTVWSCAGQPDLDTATWMGMANFVVSSSNIIARREMFARHPFKSYHFNHDYYFLSQAALRDELGIVTEPLLHYRVHPTNTINTRPAPLIRELLRQWLDLYHDLAPELATSTVLRQRFASFIRASWDNVSGLHGGLLQSVIASFLAGIPSESLEATIRQLDESTWPELSSFPNKDAVTRFDGSQPLGRGSGALATRIAELRDARDASRNDAAALREVARLRQSLLASRWAALGRLLGCAGRLETDSGRTPAAKLESLQAAIRRSSWLRTGARLRLWHPPHPEGMLPGN